METKDLNNIGLAYLQMVEKRNTEAKKNHANALHKNQKALDVHSDEDEDHNDDPTDGDGDIDAADLKKLRADADKDDKKFDKKKKSSKKDGDDQEKFKAYTGDDKDGQQGAAIGEDKEDKFEPHMMYDPKTGKGYKAEKEEDHLRMKKMGYTHDKPEEIDEAMTMVSRKPHPEGGHIVTLKDKNDKKVVRHLHNGKVKTISKESVEIDEAKNRTTKDNALVSFYQIHSTSSKPRLAGHMNMEVLGGQHQMSATDIKNISNRAVKAGVGKMVKIDNSMLPKHIADYKKENKPAPPKIAVALSQHHAKSLDESTDLQEGAARQAAFHKGLMDYCKEIGKDHMDHKDFMDHAKHVKAGNWDKARAHADDQDTEVREKIHTLAIDHLGQGAASELYGGDRVSLSKNKGDGKLHASYNESVNVDEATIPDGQTAMTKKPELTKKDKKTMGKIADLMKTANESVNVDDVLALIDQGYTLDQAEAMVAEACGAPVINSSKKTDDKKLLKASRKQSKAGDNDRNMANNQRSIPAKGADTAPVRPGTKQDQRDFDKAARMAKSKDKVSVAKAPWESVEVDEGYGSMVSPEDRARIKARVDANMDKLSAGQKKIAKQTPPRDKITRDDFEHLRTKGHANSPQKESVMDRVSNMVEGIRADIQEKKEINEGPGDINNPMKGMTGRFQGSGPAEPMRVKTMSKKREKELRDAGKLSNSANNASHYAGEAVQNVNELDKKTLGSYVKKAVPDMDTQTRFATEYEKRGMAAKNLGVMDKNFKKANRAGDKVLNRRKGINTAIDKMTKESVQEAAKPTAIHHSTPVTAAQANDAEATGRATDTVARRGTNMTEKEFIDIHKVPETVDPAFDGNVAAKDTAENIKKAPKVSPTPNKNPTAGDKNIVKSTEAPATNTAVVGESYMDKYAKYIRGEI